MSVGSRAEIEAYLEHYYVSVGSADHSMILRAILGLHARLDEIEQQLRQQA